MKCLGAYFTLVIALSLTVVGCSGGRNADIGASFAAPSGVVSRTSQKISAHRLRRIGVVAFRNESGVDKAGVQIANIFYEGLKPSARFEVHPPPPTEDDEIELEFRRHGARSEGIRNQASDSAWLKDKVNKFVSTVQPYLTNIEIVYPGEYFEGRIEAPKKKITIDTVAKSSDKVGNEPPLDAVLTGVITKFRNRSGGPFAGDKGSHVTYTAYLVSTKNGEILWEATFNEEQIYLLDNLLLLPRYAANGFIWQRSDQLARSGLKRVLATFPGLREKIEEKP
ncbi:MAG: hypothetical protein HOG04_00205 [Nitrospinaceae bacterium]|nr:hypothetical protein [Nitrospinaceae bacterium]